MEPNKNINQPKDAAGSSSATASKRATSKKPQGVETSPPDVGATPPPNQGATQPPNQAATPSPNTGDQDLLQKAKQTTGEIVNQVQQRAGSQISQQKETAANELSTVVNAVRRFGESLSNEANGPIARYAADYGNKAADSLQRLTDYIRQQEPKQLLNDVQNFGRRQPALLIGGAFLLGFAGARLIKSSLEASSQSSTNMSTQRPMITGARSQSFNANAPATQPSQRPGAV